jgi:hypothetical protein
LIATHEGWKCSVFWDEPDGERISNLKSEISNLRFQI